MNIDELKAKLQQRVVYQPTGLCIRKDSEKPMLDGVAIVVNKETVLYEGSDWREIEVIDPNCIREEYIKTQDIKLNLLHERMLSFNRYPSGALVLESREDGLHFSAPGDDSAIARQAYDLTKNGTYTGCSFEFRAKDYTVSERKGADGKTEYVIRHQEFEMIRAITIGMDPAYKQTSVNARELYRELNGITDTNEPDAEAAKRDAEEKAKAEKEQREKEEAEKREKETLARSLNDIQSDLEDEEAIDAREKITNL